MLSVKRNFEEILPLSAKTGDAVQYLERLIRDRLPNSKHLFDQNQLTDKSERFLAAEIIREKLMRQLGNEIPYSITVDIEQFKNINGVSHIDALILVERDSQKSIVIGEKGQKIKLIGTEARKDIEVLLDRKIMLKTWVKVKQGWSDDDKALNRLGFEAK